MPAAGLSVRLRMVYATVMGCPGAAVAGNVALSNGVECQIDGGSRRAENDARRELIGRKQRRTAGAQTGDIVKAASAAGVGDYGELLAGGRGEAAGQLDGQRAVERRRRGRGDATELPARRSATNLGGEASRSTSWMYVPGTSRVLPGPSVSLPLLVNKASSSSKVPKSMDTHRSARCFVHRGPGHSPHPERLKVLVAHELARWRHLTNCENGGTHEQEVSREGIDLQVAAVQRVGRRTGGLNREALQQRASVRVHFENGGAIDKEHRVSRRVIRSAQDRPRWHGHRHAGQDRAAVPVDAEERLGRPIDHQQCARGHGRAADHERLGRKVQIDTDRSRAGKRDAGKDLCARWREFARSLLGPSVIKEIST